ncbi:hypothetical protein HT136_01460 [Novosphingobium profundi]|nr:hypothetical protein [Novosphingobium profundi]MBT0667034.1 hypothetical protein [Novosphingobium profundi]
MRRAAEQAAEAVIARFTAEHPELRRQEIPPSLKWAAGVVSALLTAGISALAFWLVSTVNDMQMTLARMDERMVSQSDNQSSQFEEINRRLNKLEAFHAAGAK